jgi:tRNA (adenine22-N1)-methyltransferase
LPALREDWLDARLAAIAALVPTSAALVADIGADHGRLACALLTSRPGLRVIVTDVSADSLAKARRLLAARELTARADFRVADGLQALAGDAPDAVVLAGMGGATIRRILSAAGAAEALGDARLILQPNVEVAALRRWLTDHGFRLIEEDVAAAGRRFYAILCAMRGASAALTPREYALGPCLLARRPPAFAPYLRWRARVLADVLAALTDAPRSRDALAERRRACMEEIAWIEEALQCP